MANLIKRLPPNTLGRDFVCGDIHGAYSCVERFLREVNFDTEKDRFICAGDLIDRGPENVKCLELLLKPWFHMVKGNHEDLMAKFFARDDIGLYYWFPNGGRWATQYLNEYSDDGELVRSAGLHMLPDLPVLITVEKKDGGIFHVLHAEIYPQGEPLTDEILADEQKFADVALRDVADGETVMWGRYVFMLFYKKQMDEHAIAKMKRGIALEKKYEIFNENLSHIYSGHTPVMQPTQFYGQTNLDTLAYASYPDGVDYEKWAGLTVTEPATGKFWTVNDNEFKEVQPLVFSHNQGE